MEKTGGHAIKEHVGQTINDLTKRVAQNPFIEIASTFTNKRIAINAVKENLKNNAKEIVLWLKNESSAPKTFDFLHKYPIGDAVTKGSRNPVYDLTVSKVVLKKDSTYDLGFKMITAFPIVL